MSKAHDGSAVAVETVEGVEEYGNGEMSAEDNGGAVTAKKKLPEIKSFTRVDPTILKVDRALNISRWDAANGDEDFITPLAYSMWTSKGNKVPATVRREAGQLWLVAGYNRYDAAMLIRKGFDFQDPETGENIHVHEPNFTLAVGIVNVSREESADINSLENAMRKPMSPMDYASAITHYKDVLGRPVKSIALSLGIDQSYVSQFLKLLNLDKKTQTLVHKGKIAARAAMLLPDMDPDARAAALKNHDEFLADPKGNKKKKYTHGVGTKTLRSQRQGPGGGDTKIVSLTNGMIRDFHKGRTGPAEERPVRAYNSLYDEWMRGNFTDKYHSLSQDELFGPAVTGENVVAGSTEKESGDNMVVTLPKEVWRAFVDSVNAASRRQDAIDKVLDSYKKKKDRAAAKAAKDKGAKKES